MSWSDAARAAAAEMRKRKAAGKDWRIRPRQYTREVLSSARLFKNKEQPFPMYKDLPQREISISAHRLAPTQKTLSMKTIRRYMAGKGDFSGSLPEVVRTPKGYLVTDGHHRAAAALFSKGKGKGRPTRIKVVLVGRENRADK